MGEGQRKVIMKLEELKMHFPIKRTGLLEKERKAVRAVDGVTIEIYEGETFGLVGESGCGKSTLGRILLQLYKQTSGTVLYGAVTIDKKVPKYVDKIISEIGRIEERGVEELIEKRRECVRLAGGLLLLKDRSRLAEALRARYGALAQQNRKEEELEILGLQQSALMESEKETERNKAKGYDKRIKEREMELHRLEAEAEKSRLELEKLREECRGDEGYARLEVEVEHSIDLSRLTGEEMRVLLCDIQMVFQDPYSSLNPRMTVGQLIAEALVAHNMYKRGTKQMERYTLDIMEKCGLQAYMLHRYPHQFSGGQRQRIGIARALALKPKFVVCDEAVSALDVSIQSQIINLLMDLKEQEKLTYLFISHDLSAVKFISDRIAVMYLGNIIEMGEADVIFDKPYHPYTEALIDAIPTTEDESNRELQVIEGDIPSPVDPPSGCKFHTRCKYAAEKCGNEVPEWRELTEGHYTACHYPLNR